MADNKVFESALNQQGDVDFVRGLKDGKSVKIHVDTLLGKAKITQQIAEAKQQITEEGNTQVQRVKYEGAALNEKVAKLERKVPQKTEEDGFYVVDSNGKIVMKYDNDGFDVAKLSKHFLSIISGGVSAFKSTIEEGFFVVDENLNIGLKLDSNGLMAKNIVTFVERN